MAKANPRSVSRKRRSLSQDSELQLFGINFQSFFNINGEANLTAMWRAAGSPEDREPSYWAQTEDAAEFISHIADANGGSRDEVVRTIKVNGGVELIAHWKIGYAYAEILSPDFQKTVNEGFVEYLREKTNPALAMLRAIRMDAKQGDPNSAVKARVNQPHSPNALIEAMKSRGCQKIGDDDPFVAALSLIERIITEPTSRITDEGAGEPL